MSETIYKLDALQSPPDARDYQAESIFPTDLSLPKCFDPRTKLLDIRDQGVQGSCVAQATASLKEIQEKKNVGFEEYMSPQFVYNHRYNRPGEGMYPRDSMNILYKIGIVPEAEYAYGTREEPSQISQSVISKAANYKALGYAYVNTIEVAKAAIFRSGACIITVPVYHNGADMWRPQKVGDVVQGGHAMTAIGYNEQGFIIRNSWGKKWGNNGYTLFPYKDWGMHGEFWTLIDDESSKPDPKYSKWYWKTWRAVKNTFANAGGLKYILLLSWIFATGVSFAEEPLAALWIPATTIAMAIYSWRKKLYMMGQDKNKK